MVHCSAYTQKKYRVKIESLSSTVKKIEFKSGRDVESVNNKMFSCSKDNKNVVTFQALKDGEILWKGYLYIFFHLLNYRYIFADVNSESKSESLLCEHEFTTSKPVCSLDRLILK